MGNLNMRIMAENCESCENLLVHLIGHGFNKTHLWGCGRIDKRIPRDQQVLMNIGNVLITFCNWDCFVSKINTVIWRSRYE